MKNKGDKMLFINFKRIILAVLSIPFFVTALAAADGKPQAKASDDYTALKAYFEQLLLHSPKMDGGEENNWIHRWMWNHRHDFTTEGKFMLPDIDAAELLKEQV